MIIVVAAVLSASDAFTVSGTIILRDDSGSGIRDAVVRDNFSVTINTETYPECPDVAEITVERVERGRLPLFVEATDCEGETTPPSMPIWTVERISDDDPFHLPGTALHCEENSACNAAEAEAQRARNAVLEKCGQVRAIRGRRDARAAAAAALAIAAAAVLGAGIAALGIPIFGTAIGAVLLGVAAGLAYMATAQALVAFRELQSLDQAEAELSDLRRLFSDAADRVNATCPRDCRSVGLDQPEC